MKIQKIEAKGNEIVITLNNPQIDDLRAFRQKYEGFSPMEEYDIEIVKKKRPRSLDANAYYFALCRQIAMKRGLPLSEVHNRNLAECGIAWEDGDGHKHWVLQKDDDWWLEQNEIHFAPTDRTSETKAGTYRWFYLLKPSHLFNSKEMSILIDNIIQDAKELGIETKTPDEIKRMKELWK